MNIDALLDPAIQDFIKAHQNSDTATLALKKLPNPHWPYTDILNQIKSRQKAGRKIPEWLKKTNIIWPAPNVIEQASSTATAQYKAKLFNGKTFIDLTGGAGIDTAAFIQNFNAGFCIEKDQDTANLLTHNLGLIAGDKVKTIHNTAENFIKTMPPSDLIFIDPARRGNGQKGKFILKDCTPNIFDLIPHIGKKTKHLLIKTSPILDITQTLRDLKTVSNVYILEHNGECKEVLYHLNFNAPIPTTPTIHALTLNPHGTAIAKHIFTQEEEKQTTIEYAAPSKYLYEPGAAAMKSGGFKTIAHAFSFKKLHEHTHLYTAETLIESFPGRCFEIIDTLPANAKKLPLGKANLTIRNFPGNVDALKKQLKIKDGGEDYLFACTLLNNKKAILHCRKA